MTSPVRAAPSPTKEVLFWAGVKRFWIEIFTGVVLVFGGVLGWRFRNDFTLPQHLFLGGLLLLTLAIFLRRVWDRLFGPVLFYDLVRMSRRSQYILLRSIYSVALIVLLYWQYSEWTSSNTPRWNPRVPAVAGAQALAKSMAVFAERFFNIFMILQFFLVFWLTPVYAATCIAEEKDRKTLEFLLATDLGSREIVLSKLVSRLANLALIVLTGLPVLSLLQFLGGVDPELVLAGFAATGITMLSLTSLSVLCSVYARKPRDAILLAYLCLIAYVGVGYLLEQILAVPMIAKMSLIPGTNFLTPGDIINGINAGNLPIVLLDLRKAWVTGSPLADLVTSALRSYAICHAVITVFCVGWSILRLRSVALRQRAVKQVRKMARRFHPRLGYRPMLWKEVFVEPGFRLTRMGWVVVAIFVLISLVPPVWITGQYYYEVQKLTQRFGAQRAGGIANPVVMMNGTWGTLGEHLNLWVRATGTIIGCLLLIGVAARASTSISGERDRETLDAILASPLQSHDILFAKWLGSLLSVRWGFLWLGLIWLIGLVTGAMHPLALALFTIAWAVYASCLAGVGLWFSTACRTTLRATLCTLTTTAVLGGIPYLLFTCCFPFSGLRMLGQELFGVLAAFSPPTVLYQLTANRNQIGRDEFDLWAIIAFFGLFVWTMTALSLWTITRSRFRRITARMPYRRPELRRGRLSSGWGHLEESESWGEHASRVR